MKVKAVDGVRVPKEGMAHEYITAHEVVEVENTLYYQRRVADGDLVIVEQAVKKQRKGASDE
ncbi:hypothetical protein A4G19_03750 [Pasteurellaceae bacterium Macca]|nr:hypothetical protein [Pasteurellaceae bacterium Macca]